MAREKKAKKKKKKSPIMGENSAGLVCENCRTPVPGNINLCPKCGLSPSVQAMTDVYKPGFTKKIDEGKEK